MRPWWILLEIRHTHNFSPQLFVKIRGQESVLFVDSNVHLGHPNIVKTRRQIFQGKASFRRQPHIPQASAVHGFRSKENAFCKSVLGLDACSKNFGQLSSFSCVTNTMRPLMDRNVPEITKLVDVRILSQQTLFDLKPIGQTPRSNIQGCLWIFDNFRLDHEVRLKTQNFVSGRYMFSLQGRFFSSPRNRRLEVVGASKNGRERETREGRGSACPEGPRKSSRAPSLITWQPLCDLSKILTENDWLRTNKSCCQKALFILSSV